ncbi:MAG: S8 family serine peptidase [Planctomycetota bacterium JB042]
MRPTSRVRSLALLVATLSSAPAGLGAAAADDGAFDAVRPLVVVTRPDGSRIAAGELLVGLSSWSERAGVVAALEAGGATLLGRLPRARLLRFEVPAGAEAAWVDRAAEVPGVAYAEPNGVGRGGGSTAPNDPFFAQQWHLLNPGTGPATAGADIDAVPAWGIQTGESGVVVSVLDSGIDFANPEFVGRLRPGFDFVAEDSDPTADHPHGILVTGLLAANTGNGFGVAGVDRGCTVLPVKVLDAFNFGTIVDLVQGIDYSVAQGADIVSMSLINYPPSQALVNSLAAAHAAGVILVACGGNNGIGNADVTYPGASPFTISIGWTDENDGRVPFSGTGAALDFVAPGLGVGTVDPSGANAVTGFSGCSAATPVAAGIVALLKAQNPSLTQDQVYELLRVGAEDQVGPAFEDTPGKDVFYGHGRLNAFRSLSALCGCTDAQPLVASPQEVSLSAGGAQRLRVDVGPAFAGATCLLLGSASGTQPGLPVGSESLPLNLDAYTGFLLANPNTVIAPSLGPLDAAGRSDGWLAVPAGTLPSLAGLTLHHAALVFSGAPSEATVLLATNAAALTLVP